MTFKLMEKGLTRKLKKQGNIELTESFTHSTLAFLQKAPPQWFLGNDHEPVHRKFQNAFSTKSVHVSYNNFGPPSHQCPHFDAIMWYEERSNKARRARNPSFSLCCHDGKVLLSRVRETPPPLNTLLDYADPATSWFRDQIRIYNSMFCFTFFGAKIDHSINTGRAPYTFRINGQNYHLLGSLLPIVGVQPRIAQLYFFDTENEVRNRMSAFINNEAGEEVDEIIVRSLIGMLNHSSSLARAFRMARDWCATHNSVNFQLRLLGQRTTSRQYNAPSVSEVVALITNDFGEGIATRDIIVNNKDTGPQRILELHPAYIALQYPLLFPYGEDGLHEKISYHSNTGNRKTTCGFVTMKEYYAYMIQQQNNQGTTLIRGGRLFQQYLVDAYTAVEEQRLKWNIIKMPYVWISIIMYMMLLQEEASTRRQLEKE
ncbi:hypothetical protein OROMI_019395 [Orobanche minor]